MESWTPERGVLTVKTTQRTGNNRRKTVEYTGLRHDRLTVGLNAECMIMGNNKQEKEGSLNTNFNHSRGPFLPVCVLLLCFSAMKDWQ